MSKVWEYVVKTLEGVGRYFDANKLIVLFIAVLLTAWIMPRKIVGEKGNRFLMYSVILGASLLFPVTAVVIMFYQTAFYDYEWAFSMLPVTAVTAYGLAILLRDYTKQGKKLIAIVGAILVTLCLCGNQGVLQKVSVSENAAIKDTENILESISDVAVRGECIVWAPQKIMQQLRRQDGEILLIYGRDMWDAKSGAYDYEVYSEELTQSYVWLEAVVVYEEFAVTLESPKEALANLLVQYELAEECDQHLQNVLQAGANTIILPNLLGEWAEEQLVKVAEEKGLKITKAYTEQYIIYLFN